MRATEQEICRHNTTIVTWENDAVNEGKKDSPDAKNLSKSLIYFSEKGKKLERIK